MQNIVYLAVFVLSTSGGLAVEAEGDCFETYDQCMVEAEAEAKTKNVVKMLKALGADKKALIVTKDAEPMVVRAAGNIPDVKTTFVGSLNVVDILNCDKFIISQDAVKLVEEVYAE